MLAAPAAGGSMMMAAGKLSPAIDTLGTFAKLDTYIFKLNINNFYYS